MDSADMWLEDTGGSRGGTAPRKRGRQALEDDDPNMAEKTPRQKWLASAQKLKAGMAKSLDVTRMNLVADKAKISAVIVHPKIHFQDRWAA